MSGFGGVTGGGGRKVNNRPSGPDGYSIKGKVKSKRPPNPQNVKAHYAGVAENITRGNAGLQQRHSILEKQYNEAYHNKNYCDHGCSHGSNVGSTGKNPMEILSLGMDVASMTSSIFGQFMQRPQLTPTKLTTPTKPTIPTKSVSLNPGEIGSSVKSVNGNVISDMEEITNMQKATNSTDLRTAISAATAKRDEINATLAGLQQKAISAKNELKSTKGFTETFKKAMDESKESMNAAAQDKKTAVNTLNAYKDQLSTAGQAYVDAVNVVQGKETELQNAKDVLANTPTDAENYSELSARVNTLESELNAAKQKEQEAKTALETAQDKEKDAKMKLDKMVANYENASRRYDKSKNDYDQHKKQYETNLARDQKLEEDIKKFEQAQAQVKDLSDAIKDQQSRLEKLEKAEAKELENTNERLAKLEKENNRLLGKIDLTDGKNTRAEERRQERIQSNAPEIKSLTERKAQLEAQIKATINNGNCIYGSAPGIASFKGALIGNKYYYLVGEKVYTAEQFDALKEEGQRRQNERLAKKNTSDV